MCDSSFSADFFNNVAAVAVVLIFAKVVTNRSRKAKNAANEKWGLAVLHVSAVVSAAAAVGLSLWATGVCQRSSCIEIAAAAALGITAVFLIVDIVIGELPESWLRRSIFGKSR